MEIYAAVEVGEIARKSTEIIKTDLEKRFLPILIDDLKTNPKGICYDAAEETRKELIDTMEIGYDHAVLKGEHHMLKITIEVKVETVHS